MVEDALLVKTGFWEKGRPVVRDLEENHSIKAQKYWYVFEAPKSGFPANK